MTIQGKAMKGGHVCMLVELLSIVAQVFSKVHQIEKKKKKKEYGILQKTTACIKTRH
jgi:hypothetical protein